MEAVHIYAVRMPCDLKRERENCIALKLQLNAGEVTLHVILQIALQDPLKLHHICVNLALRSPFPKNSLCSQWILKKTLQLCKILIHLIVKPMGHLSPHGSLVKNPHVLPRC